MCAVITLIIVLAGITLADIWYDHILTAATVFIHLFLWYGKLKLFRLALLAFTATMLTHNILTLNYMGIAVEITIATSIFIFLSSALRSRTKKCGDPCVPSFCQVCNPANFNQELPNPAS